MARDIDHYDAVIDAPFGRIGVLLRDEAIVDIGFLSKSSPLISPKTAAARRACVQLQAYLKNPRTRFDLKLSVDGTAFQQRVWSALRRIPSGKVTSYGALARRLETSARAVGNACRANPIPIVVPCHRVVSATGDGGFMGKRAGQALLLKRWLLAHERDG